MNCQAGKMAIYICKLTPKQFMWTETKTKLLNINFSWSLFLSLLYFFLEGKTPQINMRKARAAAIPKQIFCNHDGEKMVFHISPVTDPVAKSLRASIRESILVHQSFTPFSFNKSHALYLYLYLLAILLPICLFLLVAHFSPVHLLFPILFYFCLVIFIL